MCINTCIIFFLCSENTTSPQNLQEYNTLLITVIMWYNRFIEFVHLKINFKEIIKIKKVFSIYSICQMPNTYGRVKLLR